MCGICGAWRADHTGLEASLHEAMAKLVHRGPDGEGHYIEPGAAIGMRRLAVIDVEGGHQPVWNEGRDVAIVMNGEVYNYRELLAEAKGRGHHLATRSDTEAVLHRYEDDDLAFVRHLRGMFALAILDRRRRRLVLARDRFGKKPLYYTHTPAGGLLFASELKALVPLMRSAGFEPEIDPQAIYDYLSFGVVPQPSTVYRGVTALPPASMLIADADGLRVERYWTPELTPKLALRYRAAQDAVRELIAEAVTLRLRSDVPLGVFLSGGIDSTIVTYEAARTVGETLRTFTIASHDPDVDESAIAARTASRYGVRNTMLVLQVDPVRDLDRLVRQYDQPFADPSALPSMRVSQLAREHVTVVLNGDGGDEMFGGYRRHLAAHLMGVTGWVPRRAGRWLADRLSPGRRPRRSVLGLAGRWFRGLGLPPEVRYLVWTSDMLLDGEKREGWRPELRPRPSEDVVAAALDARGSALDRQIAADLRLNLLSALLVKMDIATMAASLEGRSPFLDHHLAEMALRLPARYKIRGRRTKAILRDAYVNELPPEVARGSKRGFEVPLARYLANDWRPLVLDTVGATDARVRNYLDDGLVNRAITPGGFAERNNAYVTYALLVLELWLRSLER
jgi:asparagine synthase (glutamine-hydrolysing)